QQLRARAVVAGSRAGQLRQDRAGRKPNLDRVAARRISIGYAGIISIRSPADAIVKTDVAGKTRFIIRGEEDDGCVWIIERIAADIPVIIAFPRDDVGIAPARAGSAAGELMMEIADFGHLVVAVLAQIICLRHNRESAGTRGITRVIE